MKRALGAVTTWDTFQKMTEGDADAAAESVAPTSMPHVHVAPHVHEAAAAVAGGKNALHEKDASAPHVDGHEAGMSAAAKGQKVVNGSGAAEVMQKHVTNGEVKGH